LPIGKRFIPQRRLINFLLERGETSEKQLARLGIENWEVILERLESLGLLQRETRPVVRSRVPEDRVVELASKHGGGQRLPGKNTQTGPASSGITFFIASGEINFINGIIH